MAATQTPKNANSQKASGKFVLRLKPELHSRLKRKASAQSLSLNQLCAELLERSLDDHSQELPEALLTALRNFWGSRLDAILLFGSKARKTNTPSSDIDLLLVMSENTPITRQLYFEWDTIVEQEPTLKSEHYSPQFVSLPAELEGIGSLWLEVALEGKLLWEQGSQVSQRLNQIRNAIAQGHFKRQLTHGHPYWIKKELG